MGAPGSFSSSSASRRRRADVRRAPHGRIAGGHQRTVRRGRGLEDAHGPARSAPRDCGVALHPRQQTRREVAGVGAAPQPPAQQKPAAVDARAPSASAENKLMKDQGSRMKGQESRQLATNRKFLAWPEKTPPLKNPPASLRLARDCRRSAARSPRGQAPGPKTLARELVTSLPPACTHCGSTRREPYKDSWCRPGGALRGPDSRPPLQPHRLASAPLRRLQPSLTVREYRYEPPSTPHTPCAVAAKGEETHHGGTREHGVKAKTHSLRAPRASLVRPVSRRARLYRGDFLDVLAIESPRLRASA